MTLEKSVFLTGTELDDGRLMIGAQNGNFDIALTPHTIIKIRTADPEGAWSDRGQMKWTSACVAQNVTNNGVIFVGPYGRWIEMRTDGHTKGDIIDEVDEDDPPTVFRFAKSIDGHMYAGGLDRYIYKLTGKRWDLVSTQEMIGYEVAGSAENLTGFGADELYMMGWDGEIWTNQGSTWHRVESPTNLLLHDADVLDDRVYVGGQIGVILEGRGNDWTIIENELLEQDIWSVRAFDGAVYFSTMSGILCLRDGNLSVAQALGPDMRSAMSLFVGPSGLWSVGASDIVLFGGADWLTIAQS
jgi:outer membrane protein assembly factor BamB